MDEAGGVRVRNLNTDFRSELAALNAGMDIVPKKPTPRFRASEITEDEAALHIQGSWRRRVARRKLRRMVASVYQKNSTLLRSVFLLQHSHEGIVLGKTKRSGKQRHQRYCTDRSACGGGNGGGDRACSSHTAFHGERTYRRGSGCSHPGCWRRRAAAFGFTSWHLACT